MRNGRVLFDNDEWLTASEVADYLKMSRKAIYSAVARRELPFTKLGERRLRFSRTEIEALLRSGKVGTISDSVPTQ